MLSGAPLRIGITCYASVGGSGILASSLGEALVRRGHEVHFISSERPFRLADDLPGLHFHPVAIHDYELFKYPDYTLPLSVTMAEVSRQFRLDVLHVHYAVPHATAAILAQSMLPPAARPRLVTTLHGTDTTLLGRDPLYRLAIAHALRSSDAVTAVSTYLEQETKRLLDLDLPIEVIHNFFTPRPALRSRESIRQELGLDQEVLLFHSSNLRAVKRVELLLETVARIRPRDSFKLVVLAGGDFSRFHAQVRRLELESQIVVLHKVKEIEEYLQAADLGIFTSESESFCLSILEAMCFACPSLSTCVGGIPEVIQDGATGRLVLEPDPSLLAQAAEELINNSAKRTEMGLAAQQDAQRRFSAEAIVPLYEQLYRRVCSAR